MPYIAVLTDPTTGSAYTGFISLADFLIAEPNALVGYAALRALQESEGDDLPAGAHTSESHLAARADRRCGPARRSFAIRWRCCSTCCSTTTG